MKSNLFKVFTLMTLLTVASSGFAMDSEINGLGAYGPKRDLNARTSDGGYLKKMWGWWSKTPAREVEPPAATVAPNDVMVASQTTEAPRGASDCNTTTVNIGTVIVEAQPQPIGYDVDGAASTATIDSGTPATDVGSSTEHYDDRVATGLSIGLATGLVSAIAGFTAIESFVNAGQELGLPPINLAQGVYTSIGLGLVSTLYAFSPFLNLNPLFAAATGVVTAGNILLRKKWFETNTYPQNTVLNSIHSQDVARGSTRTTVYSLNQNCRSCDNNPFTADYEDNPRQELINNPEAGSLTRLCNECVHKKAKLKVEWCVRAAAAAAVLGKVAYGFMNK